METRLVRIDIARLESDLAKAVGDLRDAESRIDRLNDVLEYVRDEDGESATSNGRTNLAGIGTAHAACEAVLRENGESMRTAEIVGALAESGYGEHLSSLHNSAFTAMDRHPETFIKIHRGVWGLVDWDKQSAGISGFGFGGPKTQGGEESLPEE